MTDSSQRSIDSAAQEMIERADQDGIDLAWDRYVALASSVSAVASAIWVRVGLIRSVTDHRQVSVARMQMLSPPAT